MPSRDEMAKKACCIHLNQARPQRRDVTVDWLETGVETIECHRSVRVGVFGSPPKRALPVFQKVYGQCVSPTLVSR